MSHKTNVKAKTNPNPDLPKTWKKQLLKKRDKNFFRAWDSNPEPVTQ